MHFNHYIFKHYNLGTDEINKWTSPRKSSRTSGNLTKTTESEVGETVGDECNGGGRGARRSLGGGERERAKSIQQESAPKRKSTGGTTNRSGGNSLSGKLLGGRGFGGGGTGRNSTGEDGGGTRESGRKLGRTDLRNGGGGGRGRLDGEIDEIPSTSQDLNSQEVFTNVNQINVTQEKIVVSVQESIDEYQKHLNKIKKVNAGRTAEMQASEEKRQAKKSKSKKKKVSKVKPAKEAVETPEMQQNKENKEPELEMECLVKDEVCDAMEVEEDGDETTIESKNNSELNSKESLSNTSLNIPDASVTTKENYETDFTTSCSSTTTDSPKDSKSSSDQENGKVETLKKLKKKPRGKFRLTTKTNKSKQFAVVQSDTFIKTFNKAINDNEAESSKTSEGSTPSEEESLVLRKTERERPLSKRLLQKKLLRTKLKELGKKLLLDETANTNQTKMIKLFKKPERPSKDPKNKENEAVVDTNGSENSIETKEGRGEPSKHPSSDNVSEIPDSDEIFEECLYKEECTRKFSSYFSMMRHVAFSHRPERTAELMKLKLKNKSII